MDATVDGDVEMLLRSFLEAHRPRTREAYATDVRQWFAWLAEIGIAPLEAKRRHVLAWRAELRERIKECTINRKLSAVAGFYESAIADDALDANPTHGVKRARVSQESTRSGLDQAEWLRFQRTAREAGPAEYALVLLLGMNGLRISEAINIRHRDLRMIGDRQVVDVVGKGAKPAVIPLHPATAAAVRAVAGDDQPDPAARVLPWASRYAGKDVIVALAAAAGITSKRITPHSLRHTFVTLALELGVPLHLVQDSARHADPRTTQRYNRARDQLEHHATYALEAYLDQPEQPGDSAESPDPPTI